MAAARALDMRASNADGGADIVGLRLDWSLGLESGLGLEQKNLNESERGGEKLGLRLRKGKWHERGLNINS